MQPLAKRVLNLGVTEPQLNRYKVLALLYRLGQAEEILAMLSAFSFKEMDWKKYNFKHVPTAAKRYDGKTVCY